MVAGGHATRPLPAAFARRPAGGRVHWQPVYMEAGVRIFGLGLGNLYMYISNARAEAAPGGAVEGLAVALGSFLAAGAGG